VIDDAVVRTQAVPGQSTAKLWKVGSDEVSVIVTFDA